MESMAMIEAIVLGEAWMIQSWAWLLGLTAAAGAAILMQRRHKSMKFTVGLSCEVSVVESSFVSSSVEAEATHADLKRLEESLQEKAKIFCVFNQNEGYQKCEDEDSRNCKGIKEREEDSDDEELHEGYSNWGFPDWASSLFQPLEYHLAAGSELAERSSRLRRSQHADEWDAVLDMYSESRNADWLEIARNVLPTSVWSPTIVAKGPLYLAKAKNQVVKLWGRSSKRMKGKLYIPDDQGHVAAVDFGGSDEAVIGSSDGYLSLWDLASSQCVRSWKQISKGGSVKAMSSSDCWSVISGSSSVIQVWDPRSVNSSVGVLETKDDVVKMESADDKVFVREFGGKVRGYDLRRLGSSTPVQEGKVTISDISPTKNVDNDSDSDWCEVEEDDVDDDEDEYSADENQVAKTSGMGKDVLHCLTNFIKDLISTTST